MSIERGKHNLLDVPTTKSEKHFHCPACPFFNHETFSCTWTPKRKAVHGKTRQGFSKKAVEKEGTNYFRNGTPLSSSVHR